MSQLPNNDTRTRILDAADALFSKRGYTSVTLRDIGAAVGMKHASLYYYVPGGKEQLFVEVMERNLQRHRDGLTAAIASAENDVRAQFRAVARWLVSQPPMDIQRMLLSDMPALGGEHAERLSWMSYNALREPLVGALKAAGKKLTISDYDFAAMSFITIIESVHTLPRQYMTKTMDEVIEDALRMVLYGWYRR